MYEYTQYAAVRQDNVQLFYHEPSTLACFADLNGNHFLDVLNFWHATSSIQGMTQLCVEVLIGLN